MVTWQMYQRYLRHQQQRRRPRQPRAPSQELLDVIVRRLSRDLDHLEKNYTYLQPRHVDKLKKVRERLSKIIFVAQPCANVHEERTFDVDGQYC